MEFSSRSVNELPSIFNKEKNPNLTSLFNNADSSKVSLKDVLHRTEVTAMVLILLVSLLSNGLVFILFYLKPLMRTYSNRFVLNLAVAHILQCILVFPNVLLSVITEGWQLGEVWCQLSAILTVCLNLTTVYSLLLIAEDRNCAVNSPLRYSSTVTKRKSIVFICGAWICSFILSLPPLFGVSKIQYREEWHSCTVLWYTQDLYSITYRILLTFFGFILPFTKIIWIYFSMFVAARTNVARAGKHAVKPNSSIQENISSASSAGRFLCCWESSLFSSYRPFLGEECKAAVTGIMVVFTLAFCWAPFFTIVVAEPFLFDKEDLTKNSIIFFVTFATVSSGVINPYLYVFRNKDSRGQVKQLLECRDSRRNLPKFLRNNADRKMRSAYVSCILKSFDSNPNVRYVSNPIIIHYQGQSGHWKSVNILDEEALSQSSQEVASLKNETGESLLEKHRNESEDSLPKSRIFYLDSVSLVHQCSTESDDRNTCMTRTNSVASDDSSRYSQLIIRKGSESSVSALLEKGLEQA